MKDEEKQAVQTFEGHYKEFQIAMRFTKEEFVDIVAENTTTCERFSQLVDHSTLTKLTFFDEPIDLRDYPIAIQDGAAEFQYSLDKSEGTRKKVKKVVVPLKKQEIDPQQLAERKMQAMCLKIASLQAELNQRKDLETEMLKLREKNQALSKEVQKLTEIVRFQQNEIQTHKRLGLPFKNSIGHHQGNAHKQAFTILKTWGTTSKLRRVVAPNKHHKKWYNFVNEAEILPYHCANYKVQTSKTFVWVGFCTNSGLGELDNFNNAESAYFSYSMKKLYYSGKEQSLNITIKLGPTSVVECIADMVSGKFIWRADGEEFAQCAVPEQMREKVVYLSVIMSEKEDDVDFMI